MTEVLSYSPEIFDELPTFRSAQASLQHFEAQLVPVAEVVSKHGGDARVGLALLHRHFTLHPNERLVEEVIPERRLSIGRPRIAGSCPVVPHLFRAIRREDGYAWYPLEFVHIEPSTEGAPDSYAWFEAHTDLLDAVGTTLDEAGALDVFGLSLSHGREDIECGDDEVLVESTDEVARTLRMEPRRLAAVNGLPTPTNWSIEDGGVRMRCTCQRDQSGSHQHFETN